MNLKRRYKSTWGNCCKCGCRLETFDMVPLGLIYKMDKKGKFYCLKCETIFEEKDERLYEPDEDI